MSSTAAQDEGALPRSPRPDLYRFIHKAVRVAMFDTLRRLGVADADDPQSLQPAIAQAQRLLALIASHVRHENDFVHTAIEARRPGGAQGTAEEHRAHLQTIESLEGEISALRDVHPDGRAMQAEQLYRHLAVFIAEQLQHMALEESHNNAALWALYSDGELLALHDRLVASIEPLVLQEALLWMAQALSTRELVELLRDMRAKAPPEAFGAVLGRMREQLERARWMRVARGLGLSPAG